jgi:hypothetical protein
VFAFFRAPAGSSSPEGPPALLRSRGAQIGGELLLAATKRRKAGVNGRIGRRRDETVPAVQSAFRAIRRNSLAARAADAYSSPIEATNPQRKDHTMNAKLAAPIATRLAAFAAAVLTSTVVLGATVLGMQPEQDASRHVVALERVIVTAPSIN